MPNKQKVTRKLRAILSADVKGYSLLMADDEVHTIQTLKAYRQIMSDLIQQNSGRVVDNPGDNLLAEFSSAVDAVECAVNVQKKLKKENAKFVEDKKLQFRIGVNIGDVVQEDDRIYGGGVNVAARIECLADAGGICVSRSTYDQIKNKLELSYDYLGEFEVKNIKEPVRVYKVILDADFSGPLFDEKPELPNNPSIAVLPLDNLSRNPEDESIADGLSESIITALSNTPKMLVISRNSTFTYKGKATKIQKIAEDLGVRYVLEGSLQKSADRLRINVQLIDAITGNHIWAGKYDRNMTDFFALQDDIAMKIITALNVKLTHGEQANVTAKNTDNLEAYLKVLQGLNLAQSFSRERLALAKEKANEAIFLDPNYPAAYYLLSYVQCREVLIGAAESPKVAIKSSIENAEKAITMDNTYTDAHAFRGWLYVLTRQYDEAVTKIEYALTLNPNSVEVYYLLGLTINYAGKHEEAIKIYEKGLRLSPLASADYFLVMGMAYHDCKRYNESIQAFKKAIYLEPDTMWAHFWLASCYVLTGRNSEAKAEVDEVMRINPNFSLELPKGLDLRKDRTILERTFAAMLKAGLFG